MSFLLIPVAPLSKSKSRLIDCFSREQLKDFTVAMFKDLVSTLKHVNCYSGIIVYCYSPEILEIANENGLVGIKEENNGKPLPFNEVISNLNNIAIKKLSATSTVISFVDVILIDAKKFQEIHALTNDNQLVFCPAARSAGISVLGRNPPDIVNPDFLNPNLPSLFTLYNNAKEKGIEKIAIYDSFRAGFDIDLKEDLLLAYEYLKIFNLTHTETYAFLKNNLKMTIKKIPSTNNRQYKITKTK